MKKFASLALVILMLLMTMAVPAVAETVVTAQANNNWNVPFSDDYYGYCLDAKLDGAHISDRYVVADASNATSNIGGTDISEKLKILFTQCFSDIFVLDDNGEYVCNDNVVSDLGFVIYHYSDPDRFSYLATGPRAFYEKIEKCFNDGLRIPNSGYELLLDNNDVITFDFIVLIPESDPTNITKQSFFAYKLNVQKAGSTEPEETKVTVSFDANGGTGSMADQEFVNGEEKALTPNDFTNENHEFTGWNTQPDGSGTTYSDQQKIKPDSDITLYAQWEKITPDNTGNPPLFPDNTDNPPLFPDSSDNPPSLPGGDEIEWPSESVPAIPETGDASTPLLWAGLLLLSLCGVVCMRRKAFSR